MNTTIDSRLRRKTMVYIIIGIIIVILLAVYIYMTISAKQNSVNQQAITSQNGQPVTLTRQQAAAKVAVIDQITSEQPNQLSSKNAPAREAALSKLESEQ
jgi:flagellar basal body-associated protein FliL